MTPDAPFNVTLLDVDEYIQSNNVPQITSLSIYEPSSRLYDTNGLFSERVFGPIGSTERLIRFGYIRLNTDVMQPLIYKNVIKLTGFYEEIMAGTSYAIFDPELNDFVRCSNPELHNDAGTGYSFFMNHFAGIKFVRNKSRIRSDRIDMIERYRNILLCSKFLVMPAGLRDLEEDQGRLTTDDINKLYQSLLSLSFAIPPNAISTIYDGVRYSIQRKIVEIYDYVENILVGKRGYIQGTWGHRRVALGTRNVITAASYATMTPNDPQTIQPDETKIGLFQTMKALQPIVVHHVRKTFIEPVFGQGSNTVPLIDPKTLKLVYCNISNQELARYESSEAIEDWISRFRNIDIRNKPVTITDENGKSFYLLMIYDEDDQISLFRNIDDFKTVTGDKIDRNKIRPLTWAELFYMATYNAAMDKHVLITRYPVIQDESCYPTRIHLASTVPSRVVQLKNSVVDSIVLTYPEYPVIGRPFLDSIQVGTARLKGLDGDKAI